MQISRLQKWADNNINKIYIDKKINPDQLGTRNCCCRVSFVGLRIECQATNLGPSVEEEGQERIQA